MKSLAYSETSNCAKRARYTENTSKGQHRYEKAARQISGNCLPLSSKPRLNTLAQEAHDVKCHSHVTCCICIQYACVLYVSVVMCITRTGRYAEDNSTCICDGCKASHVSQKDGPASGVDLHSLTNDSNVDLDPFIPRKMSVTLRN